MEFDRAEFWNSMLGDYSITQWVIYGIFFLVGAAIFFFGDVHRSRKYDPKMPEKLDFWFMFKDNAVRFLTVIVTIFLAIRFHVEFLGIDTLNEKNCLFHGISIDAVVGKVAGHSFKQVPAVKKIREAHITKIKNGNP